MLDVLVASGPARDTRLAWPAGLTSAVVHGGLVFLAVLATRRTQAEPALFHPTTVPVVWDVPRRTPPVPGVTPAPGLPAVRPSGVLALPNDIAPPSDVPPGPSVPWVDPLPGAPGLPEGGVNAPGWTAATPVDAGVVDQPPVLLAHPPLRYPELLRQAGIEGSVTVEAVLDTAGRVEPGSLRALSETNALFAQEALLVVGASRYRPGRVGSRPVRVRVRVPVTFTLRPGAR
jgi:periplasmic protein TonB